MKVGWCSRTSNKSTGSRWDPIYSSAHLYVRLIQWVRYACRRQYCHDITFVSMLASAPVAETRKFVGYRLRRHKPTWQSIVAMHSGRYLQGSCQPPDTSIDDQRYSWSRFALRSGLAAANQRSGRQILSCHSMSNFLKRMIYCEFWANYCASMHGELWVIV